MVECRYPVFACTTKETSNMMMMYASGFCSADFRSRGGGPRVQTPRNRPTQCVVIPRHFCFSLFACNTCTHAQVFFFSLHSQLSLVRFTSLAFPPSRCLVHGRRWRYLRCIHPILAGHRNMDGKGTVLIGTGLFRKIIRTMLDK